MFGYDLNIAAFEAARAGRSASVKPKLTNLSARQLNGMIHLTPTRPLKLKLRQVRFIKSISSLLSISSLNTLLYLLTGGLGPLSTSHDASPHSWGNRKNRGFWLQVCSRTRYAT
jgi:hypothetical protein